MIRYDLAQVVVSAGKRPKRDRVLLAPIAERFGTEKSYYRALRKMLSGLAQTTNSTIVAAYAADRAQERQRRRLHDADESTFSPLKALQAALTRETSTTVNRILDLESQRHTATFMQTARAALGVDLSAVVQQEDLTDYLRAAAARNTSLITSLSADVVKRVEQSVLAAGIRGDSVQALKKILTEQYGIVDRRAQLIARDQTAKLNSDLTRIRQEQAGIENYNWMTAHDERVRPLHKSIDGKEYEWGKPTGAEDGLPPGQPIQCRCIAQGIVTFGEPVKRRSTPEPTPGAPAGSALAQAETIIVRNAKLDAAAKKYVVETGIRTKTEHLDGFDLVTGKTFTRHTSGKAGNVAMSPEMLSAASDPKQSISFHHNHPMSRSFSTSDLLTLNHFKGISELWAHGHNGSSYLARRGTKTGFDKLVFALAETYVFELIKPLAYAGKISGSDIDKIFHHLISLRIAELGYFEYRAELAGETLEAWNRNKDKFK